MKDSQWDLEPHEFFEQDWETDYVDAFLLKHPNFLRDCHDEIDTVMATVPDQKYVNRHSQTGDGTVFFTFRAGLHDAIGQIINTWLSKNIAQHFQPIPGSSGQPVFPFDDFATAVFMKTVDFRRLGELWLSRIRENTIGENEGVD